MGKDGSTVRHYKEYYLRHAGFGITWSVFPSQAVILSWESKEDQVLTQSNSRIISLSQVSRIAVRNPQTLQESGRKSLFSLGIK